MGKSYVLKEKNGNVCGFIMQTGRCLSFRITALPTKPLLLTIVYAGEEYISIAIEDSDEHQQNTDRSELVGAYAMSDGKLLMDTGEEALNAYYTRENSLERTTRMNTSDAWDRHVATYSSDSRPTVAFAKERRWPPPPCVLQPRFQNGRWIDQSMGV